MNKPENISFSKTFICFLMKSFTWVPPFINIAFLSFHFHHLGWMLTREPARTWETHSQRSGELVRSIYHKEARKWLLNLFYLDLYFSAALRPSSWILSVHNLDRVRDRINNHGACVLQVTWPGWLTAKVWMTRATTANWPALLNRNETWLSACSMGGKECGRWTSVLWLSTLESCLFRSFGLSVISVPLSDFLFGIFLDFSHFYFS